MIRATIQWLIDNEAARKAAVASVDLKGKAVPDALVTDRWFLPKYMKALVIEAVKGDAPEGVVEDLMPALRRMTRGAAGIDAYGVDVLARLEGLRDEDEIIPVLERARDEAPDEPSRQRVERVIERVRNPLSLENTLAMSDEQLDEIQEDTCASCCLHGCASCIMTCVICCAGSCWYCETHE
ncbi:hypothetical protein ACPCVO_45140 [Streptomyces umbrinus]|uniref:hypothetical protein n=1 Tax=Streptomyces umbrinus TaxID=67370 RepID=UPI003C2C6D16